MTNTNVIDIGLAVADLDYRENLIEAYKPFIASVVSKICGKYKRYGVDDELSIGLMAFNEAIDKFDGRGNFLSFAKLVIKSRLYDYFRYIKRRGEAEPLFQEDGRESHSIVETSLDNSLKGQQQQELREEIEEFKSDLEPYGIDLASLAKASPKHGKKRKAVMGVIHYMQGDSRCMEFFDSTGNLSLKLIEEQLGISRKLIEPYRKYIIASLLISKGKYAYLKEYLK